jgi:hypothetical protein
MNEQNISSLDVEVILANEELMKKLAAKVLDIIRQKPDSGVVCQGYYCNMVKGDPAEEWKYVCKKKLDSLEMELEDGLATSVAEDYPLSAEELDQVVTEIKTSEAYTGKLSRADMSRAVRKVLADNEIMRRKGSAEAMKFDYKKFDCISCGPNNKPHITSPLELTCLPCGPNNKPHITSPVECLPCGPNNKPHITSPVECLPCAPIRIGQFGLTTCPALFTDLGTNKDIIIWENFITKSIEELVTIRHLATEAIALRSIKSKETL